MEHVPGDQIHLPNEHIYHELSIFSESAWIPLSHNVYLWKSDIITYSLAVLSRQKILETYLTKYEIWLYSAIKIHLDKDELKL